MRRFWLVLIGIALPGAAVAQMEAPSDSMRTGGLLDELQQRDLEFFPDELFEIDTAFRDSVVSAHDALGLGAYEDLTRSRGPLLDFGFGIASHLWGYNRVEGFVPGVALEMEALHGHVRGRAEVAYATEPEKLRTYAELETGLGDFDVQVVAFDRVVPYGSNRPTVNALRAVVGGADEQDYLRREGGGAGLTFSPGAGVRVGVGWEAAEETSVSAGTDFALFDRIDDPNGPVTDGIDRSAEANLSWNLGSSRRLRLTATHRVAGGDLGGDFTYNTSSFGVEGRRYLVGRHEIVAMTSYTRTGGAPSIQRLADAGGLSTVRGYRRRQGVGRESFTARAELPVPYDVFGVSRIPVLRSLRLQVVPWGDVGWVASEGTEVWLQSVGIGVQRFLGIFGSLSNLRLDVAFPLGPDRDEDIRLYLRFAPGLL